MSTDFALLYACDERFSAGTLVSLASVFAATKSRSFKVYIAYDEGAELPESFWTTARLICDRWQFSIDQLVALPIDLNVLSDMPSFHTGSRMNYGRILALRSIPEELCLYLDSDTLVLDDLYNLITLMREDCDLAAIRDSRIYDHSGDGYTFASNEISPSAPYFNSGIMLLRTAFWKREDAVQQVLDIATKTTFGLYRDQTILNILFHDRHQLLPPRWNTGTRKDFAAELDFENLEPVAIIHYVGHEKPWNTAIVDVPNALWHSFADSLGISVERGVRAKFSFKWSLFRVEKALGVAWVKRSFYRFRYAKRVRIPRKLRDLNKKYTIYEDRAAIDDWLRASGVR